MLFELSCFACIAIDGVSFSIGVEVGKSLFGIMELWMDG